MTWQDIRLTAREEEQALRSAGVMPDCSRWSAEEVRRASEALNRAQEEKIRVMRAEEDKA